MTTTVKYPCSRCDGKGTIRAFSRVWGGVCFRCNGTGFQKTKPSKSLCWTVIGIDPATGEEAMCYNENAKTAKEAVRKSKARSLRASLEWQREHDLTNAFAVPSEEYWTEERIEATRAL